MVDDILTISPEGTIQLSFDDSLDKKVLAQTLKELLPLLLARAEAASMLSRPSPSLPMNRQRALMAAHMKGDICLQSALECAEGVLSLATGEISATQIGFPEFDDPDEETLTD